MLCVYCGKREATTADHVVAEGFFDVAPEGGYIKAPSCFPCNNKCYSRDEEYLLVAGLSEATIRSAAANRVLDRMAEAHRTGRRRRVGLAIRLLNNVRPHDVHSPAGIYLGTARVLEFEERRVNPVLEKIVRGLYYHELGVALPREAAVAVEIKPSAAKLGSPEWSALDSVTPRRLGDVFEYRWRVSPEGSSQSWWWFTFYDSVVAVGATAGETSA